MIAHVIVAGMIAINAAAAIAAQTPAAGIDRLDWIAGCWKRASADTRVEEHWMAPAGGTMLGMGRTVRGGKTTEYEFLQIRDVNGTLAYVARPSGQAEATFPLKTLTAREIVFEDPAHDFPQRVIYRRNEDGSITARIEGTMNGQPRGMDFPYTRCQ
jgi:hypothetical protein